MRTVTIVAKGKSAEHAAAYISQVETDIATIHEAGVLIPEVPIQWCFATHTYTFDKIEPHASRIAKFVIPKFMLVVEPITHDPERAGHDHEIWREGAAPDFVKQKQILFESCLTAMWDHTELAMAYKIMRGLICHYTTVNGALHWLAKYGRYERIRVIGVDSSPDYAATLTPGSPLAVKDITADVAYFDKAKQSTVRLCNILSKVYDIKVEWYGD